MVKIIIIIFITPFFCFAQSSDSSKQVQGIMATLNSQVTAWNNGDIDGFMNGYWKSDSLIFTSGGNIQRGWKTTLEKYKKSYDTKAKMGTLKFSQLEFTILSKSSAWVLGHWELTREKDHPEGVFTLIVRKFADGWKVVHDHTSVIEKKK